MLLEECLAGNAGSSSSNANNTSPSSTSSSSSNLSPHDEALAIMSFIRDELPAGGVPAEKRFVNLLPLIANRVYGEWNYIPAPPEGSPVQGGSGGGRSPASPSVTSPGGSTYSSPVGGAPASSPPTVEREYRHAEGGWLSLASSPTSSSQRHGSPGGGGGGSNRSPTGSSRSSSSSSLENDPIVKLLRAPRKRDANAYYANAVTLLDALSAESIHRPSVRFKFPLGGLSLVAKQLVDDWKLCFWKEFEMEGEKRAANANAVATSRGGFHGAQSSTTSESKTDEKPTGKIGKENATRILLRLLSGRPKDQLEVRSYFQKMYQQQQRQAPHGTFGSPSSYASPYRTPNNNARGQQAAGVNEPNLELTMVEYYLFLFVRYPLANTVWAEQLADQQRRQRHHYYGSGSSGRVMSPYGQRVYSYLFSTYLNYYLGQGKAYAGGRLGVGADCFDGSNNTPSTVASSTLSALDRTSELFLRLLIEFWIEGQNVPPSTNDAVVRYRRVRAGVSTSSQSAAACQPSLRDSLELAQPSAAPFVSPPVQVQSGVLTLVKHLVSDKSVRELVKNVSGQVQQRQREDRGGTDTPPLVNDTTIAGSSGGDASIVPGSMPSQNNQATVEWCLPPAMTATQPSLFNYIRLGLACGAIHDRGSIFHRALETWLIYLEPWNYVMKSRRVAITGRSGSSVGTAGSSSGGGGRLAGEFLRNAAATVSSHHRVEYYPSYVPPKPTSASKYSSEWEAYVLTNAHFYAVPLAIFLKRARELDFSSNAEYTRSLTLVQRVLRVWSSKNLVNVLNSVLNRRADVLSTSLFERHGKNLGVFCPINTKLSDCQLDATNLLEEIFGQYQKRRAREDIFDRLEAKLNALFSTGKIVNEEVALENLLTQVRYLVNLPLDYQVLPEEPRTWHGPFGLWRLLGLSAKETSVADAAAQGMPDRDADGKLTDLGRRQIKAGLCKCNPMDVRFIGDPMLARVKTYEIPALVELTIRISNYLNDKLGLVPPTPTADSSVAEDDMLLRHYRFRINLRFLADSRNIIFFVIVWSISRLR